MEWDSESSECEEDKFADAQPPAKSKSEFLLNEINFFLCFMLWCIVSHMHLHGRKKSYIHKKKSTVETYLLEQQKSKDKRWKRELALEECKIALEERKLKLEEDKLKFQQ